MAVFQVWLEGGKPLGLPLPDLHFTMNQATTVPAAAASKKHLGRFKMHITWIIDHALCFHRSSGLTFNATVSFYVFMNTFQQYQKVPA